MSFCRITGKSRGLPKPNYFPLLPPISPADAKRICRITNKSKGLPGHHYVPALASAWGSRTSCRVTAKSEGQAPHHYPTSEAALKPHVFAPGYRYVFPRFDEEQKHQKSLLALMASKAGAESANVRYVYCVEEQKTNLVIPAGLEAAVRDGEVRDVMLDQGDGTMLIKMYQGASLTVAVEDFVANDAFVLWEGKGPGEFALMRRQNEAKERDKRKAKRARAIGHRKKIFEDKERLFDEEETRIALAEEKAKDRKLQKVGVGQTEGPEKAEAHTLVRLKETLLSREGNVEPVFGHIVQSATSVKFYSGTSVADLPEGKLIPGRMERHNNAVKFVPGMIIEGKFVAGQMVVTNNGEEFVPGQVIETREGPKFIPGQVAETASGPKFVPGQTMRTENGYQFVPGQIIETKAGPTFIPGQIIVTGNLAKFVPGRVIETVDGPRFVPGRVIETGDQVTFVSGQVVDTPEGLRFVAPDLENDVDGAQEFSVQGFEVSPEELRLLRPAPRQAAPDSAFAFDSEVLKRLTEAGMSVGRQISTELPKVDVSLLPVTLERLNLTGERAVKITQVVYSLAQIGLRVNKLDESCTSSVDTTDAGIVLLRSIDRKKNLEKYLRATVASAVVGCRQKEIVTEEALMIALSAILENSLGDAASEVSPDHLVDSIYQFLQSPENLNQIVMETIHCLEANERLSDRIRFVACGAAQPGKIIKKISQTLNSNMAEAFTEFFSDDVDLLEGVVDRLKQVTKNGELADSSDSDLLGILETAIISVVKEKSEQKLGELLKETEAMDQGGVKQLQSLLRQCAGLAKALGMDAVARTLEEVISDPWTHEILCHDPTVMNILQRLTIMRQIAEIKPEFEEALRKLSIDPEAVKSDPGMRELLRRSNALTVTHRDQLLSSAQIPMSLLLSSNNLAIEEHLAATDHPRILLILKAGVQAVVPREAARAVLTGKVPYAVVDEKGIKYFEPLHFFSTMRMPNYAARCFTMYRCSETPGPRASGALPAPAVNLMKTRTSRCVSQRTSFGRCDLNLEEGVPRVKRIVFDLSDDLTCALLDNSAAKHKLSIRPNRKHADSRQRNNASSSSSFSNSTKCATQGKDEGAGGWNAEGRPNSSRCATSKRERDDRSDVLCRREAVVSELLETEEEFCRDLGYVIENYMKPSDGPSAPSIVRNNADLIFGNFRQIADFHTMVLNEGIQYYSDEPRMLGRTFVRLERDFDNHINYCRDVPLAQEFLAANPPAMEFFELTEFDRALPARFRVLVPTSYANRAQRNQTCVGLARDGGGTACKWDRVESELSQKAGDDKSIVDYLELPVQRINDYQVLLKDLVKYSEKLGENSNDLKRALELTLAIPHRANDDKFLSNIEGFHGNIHNLGRLLRHDWFTVESPDHSSKERYLFLFRDHILVSKVKKISEDRSVFSLRHLFTLSEVKILQSTDGESFQIVGKGEWSGDNVEKARVKVRARKEGSRISWLNEIRKHVPSALDEQESPRVKSGKSHSPENAKGGAGANDAELTLPEGDVNLTENMNRRFSTRKSHRSCEESCTVTGQQESYVRSRSSMSTSVSKFSSGLVHESRSAESTRMSYESPGLSTAGDKPVFTSTIAGLHVEPGDTAVFECQLASDGRLTWLKDNKALADRLADRVVRSSSSDGTHRLELQNVTEADSGTYTALAQNDTGHATCTAHLVVEKVSAEVEEDRQGANAPFFAVRLKDTELMRNTNFTFVVKVKGTPNPDVKFYKDDSLIRDSRNGIQINRDRAAAGFYELTIPDVQDRHAGIYACEAANSYGEARCTATVLVTDEKVIFKGLENDALLTSGDKPSFTWFKDGKDFDPDERFKVLLGNEDDSLALIFQHVRPDDAGLYTCVASTTAGKISCSAELSVQGTVNSLTREPEKPRILKEEKTVEADVGGSAMLEAKVLGFPKPDLKWYHEGKEISAEGRYKFLYEDQESVTLVIKNLNPRDGGSYKIIAKNELGEDCTELDLIVKGAPKVTKKMEDVVVNAMETVVIETWIEGSPAPIVKWFMNGKEIKGSERIKANSDPTANRYTLIIEAAHPKDEGSYSVVATNEVNQCTDFCQVKVRCLPEILKGMEKSVDVTEGEDLVFQIEVSAGSSPSVEWMKEGVVLKSDGNKVVITQEGGVHTLRIVKVGTNDAGDYSVEVSNECGKAVDAGSAEVCAKPCAPVFKKALTDATANEGDAGLEFSVEVAAFPKPKIRWYLDEMEITEKRSEYSKVETDNNYKLIVKRVTTELKGNYKCKVENECGSAETVAKLIVQSKPVFVKFPDSKIAVDEGADLTLQIECCGCPEPQICWYKDGEEIHTDAHIKIMRDSHRSESYSMSLTLIKESDGGNYEARATNCLGSATTRTMVRVYSKIVETSEEDADGVFKAGLLKGRQPDAVAMRNKEENEEIDIWGAQFEQCISPEKGFDGGRTVEEEKGSEADGIVVECRDGDDQNELFPGKSTFASPGVSIISVSDNVERTLPRDDSPVELEEQKKTMKRGLGGNGDANFIVDESEAAADEIPRPSVDAARNASDLQAELESDEDAEVSALCEGIQRKRSVLEEILEKEADGEKRGRQERPSFVEPLNDKRCAEKEEVTFRCILTGHPEPEIIWTRDGKELNVEDSGLKVERTVIKGHDDRPKVVWTLKIAEARTSDAGSYTARAQNVCGLAETSASLIVDEAKVPQKPVIKSLRDAVATPSGDARFEAKIESGSEFRVTWHDRNGETVATDGTSRFVTGDDAGKGICSLTIKNVKPDDVGEYVLVASNEAGETRQKARLSIRGEIPTFVKRLEDTEVKEGQDVDFLVRCNGVPKPDVKWYRNGGEVMSDGDRVTVSTHTEGQVSSSLRMQRVGVGEVGEYKIVASNIMGDAENCFRLSMSQVRPMFEKGLPRSLEVDDGFLELKCKVSASPKPGIRWFKDGKAIEPGDRVKMLEQRDGTLKLILENAGPGDAGTYAVEVENSGGKATAHCAVSVVPELCKPKFLDGLKNVALVEGEPLSLEAKIVSYPPPEIKWFKDGRPLKPNQGVKNFNDVEGKLELAIAALKPEDAGVYSVKVANKLGEVTQEARVEVTEPKQKPNFSQALLPVEAAEGFPAKFSVRVTGNPKPTVKWFRGGQEILPDGTNVVVKGESDGIVALLLKKCRSEDAGEYGASAINDLGSVSCKAALTILSKSTKDLDAIEPSFMGSLNGVAVDEGSDFVFSAPISGNPIPEITWEKDGEPVRETDRILLTCDGKKVNLEVRGCKVGDSGLYVCQLRNPSGTARSKAMAKVRKIFKEPVFEDEFMDAREIVGDAATFSCRITGNPKPDTEWCFNGVPVKTGDKYQIKCDGDTHTLIVTGCTSSDGGLYRCSAFNRAGKAECVAQLRVHPKVETQLSAEPPSFLKKINDCDIYGGMAAKFTACCSGIPTPNAEWFKDDVRLSPSDRIKVDVEGSGLLRLTIFGAAEDDVGTYILRVSNPHGSAECSARLNCDSLEKRNKRGTELMGLPEKRSGGVAAALSAGPIISRMMDRHLTLSWKPYVPSGPNPPVTYAVEMCTMPDGGWFIARRGIRSCACDIRNLEPCRDYRFRIRIENRYGLGDPSPYAETFRQNIIADSLLRDGGRLGMNNDYRPEGLPKDFDFDRPLHEGYKRAPEFLSKVDDVQYGVRNQSCSPYWFVYGYPKPAITYLFNDEPLEMGGRFECSYTRSGRATLFIKRMSDRDVGVYEAVAKNEHGEARQKLRLELGEHPAFIRRPEESHFMLRGSGTLTVRVFGVPFPEVKWYKDWQPLTSSSRIKFEQKTSDTFILAVNDVITKDEGLYSVSASNLIGMVSASSMIHVEKSEEAFRFATYERGFKIKPRNEPLSNGYDIGDELGRGTQGVTYHAVERLSGQTYAAKFMHGKSHVKPFMLNELNVMNTLNHKKLIRLYDAFETNDLLVIVEELAGGGELLEWLIKQSHITEREIAGYVRQILWGLDYMHSNGYAHLSLTLNDLLLSRIDSDDLKICDFGLSRRIARENLMTLQYGMPEFVSPEVANGEGVSYAVDLWSLGIITYILLSGFSPFKGANDRETLTKIRGGKWEFEEEYFRDISEDAKDFIRRLLVVNVDDRMDAKSALKHPWLELMDRPSTADETRIDTTQLRKYHSDLRSWYKTAYCQPWFRREPLSNAFTHPSKMVYPPGGYRGEESEPGKATREPGLHVPETGINSSRDPLDCEVGNFKSESQYQNGPDTYLLQLRDVDLPCRLRHYIKVAAERQPSICTETLEKHIDWRSPVIRERRKFMDIMDEEIDDERRARISMYGSDDFVPLRRLRHEVGCRSGGRAEAEAMLEAKQDGRLPFFREKPRNLAIIPNKNADLFCVVVGEPAPIIQWFKNDLVLAETSRIKMTNDGRGRFSLRLEPALPTDVGSYKAVAKNKVGQSTARMRVVQATVPLSPDPPKIVQVSDTEILLKWKHENDDVFTPVLCYTVQCKESDAKNWACIAENVNLEFWLVKNLKPSTSYELRLLSKNCAGWSSPGLPTDPVSTREAGSPKIEMDSPGETEMRSSTQAQETVSDLDYEVEDSGLEWDANTAFENAYQVQSEKWRGEFSSVVEAMDKSTGCRVAVKIFDVNSSTEDSVANEFENIRSLKHERIVNLISALRPAPNLAFFVMEKLEGTDILSYFAGKKECNEDMVVTALSQVLDGLQYLHWRGICHLNIQPNNIVLCSSRALQVKLIDFGSARKVSKLGTLVAAPFTEYAAPETIANDAALPQTDIWSLGAVAYVLLSGVSPFKGDSDNETRQNILFVRYRFEHLHKEITQEGTRFLMQVFKRTPSKRPTVEECYETRWFLSNESIIRKRQKACFPGTRLKAYNAGYHMQKSNMADRADPETLSAL